MTSYVVLCAWPYGPNKSEECFKAMKSYIENGNASPNCGPFELILTNKWVLCYFSGLPMNWSDSGMYDKIVPWIGKASGDHNPQDTEFYGPRPHDLSGYWRNVDIKERIRVS